MAINAGECSAAASAARAVDGLNDSGSSDFQYAQPELSLTPEN